MGPSNPLQLLCLSAALPQRFFLALQIAIQTTIAGLCSTDWSVTRGAANLANPRAPDLQVGGCSINVMCRLAFIHIPCPLITHCSCMFVVPEPPISQFVDILALCPITLNDVCRCYTNVIYVQTQCLSFC